MQKLSKPSWLTVSQSSDNSCCLKGTVEVNVQ